MQVAFGRVRRKTMPIGSPAKCPLIFRIHHKIIVKNPGSDFHVLLYLARQKRDLRENKEE